MTHIPSPRFSPARLINIGRRCGRLCTKAGTGAQKYNERIAAAMQELVQRRSDAEKYGFEVDTAIDLTVQANCALDEAVRTAFEKCEQHDRENPAEPVTLRVFPDRSFSKIVYSKKAKEPELVRQIANRIKEIGEGSPLASVAKDLDKAVETVDGANAGLSAKRRAYDDACTQQSLAKDHFVNEYKATFYDASVAHGQRYARSLFPAINTRKERNESPTGDDGADAAVPTVPALKAA